MEIHFSQPLHLPCALHRNSVHRVPLDNYGRGCRRGRLDPIVSRVVHLEMRLRGVTQASPRAVFPHPMDSRPQSSLST